MLHWRGFRQVEAVKRGGGSAGSSRSFIHVDGSLYRALEFRATGLPTVESNPLRAFDDVVRLSNVWRD